MSCPGTTRDKKKHSLEKKLWKPVSFCRRWILNIKLHSYSTSRKKKNQCEIVAFVW